MTANTRLDVNFIEVQTVDMANKVDLEIYRFDKLDNNRGYCFVKRRGK